MLIKKIKLNNFRQFKNEVEISFSTDPEKNVTLIMADNGLGKTTLSQAFLWCLYGTVEYFSNPSLLNITTQSGLESLGFASMSVEINIVQNGKDYIIRRQNTYQKNLGKVKVVDSVFKIAKIENGNINFMAPTMCDVFIKKILPKEIAKFFFFGGERIETMSKEIKEGKSAIFKEAVEGLAGLAAVQNSISHLKGANGVVGQFQKLIDDESDDKIFKYQETYEELEKENMKIDERISDTISELDELKGEIDKLDEEFLAYANEGEIKARIEKIKRDITNAENNLLLKQKDILKLFNKEGQQFLFLIFMKSILTSLKSAGKLNKGVPDIRDTTIKFLLDRGKCICGNELHEGSIEEKNLIELLEFVPPKSIGQLLDEYVDISKSKLNSGKDFYKDLKENYIALRELSQQIEAKKLDLEECEKQISKDSNASIIKSKLENKKARVRQLLINQGSDEKAKDANVTMMNTAKNKIDSLTNIAKSNSFYADCLLYTRDLLNKFNNNYDVDSKKVRIELTSRINEFLKNIFADYISIEISENYKIKVQVKNDNDDADLSSLDKSTAQGYSVIFAFISGLIDMAKNKAKVELDNPEFKDNEINYENKYSLIMDAPLSVFDKKRIKNICEVLPNIADQLVFFIKDTDGAIAENELKNKIGLMWELKAESATSTIAVGRDL